MNSNKLILDMKFLKDINQERKLDTTDEALQLIPYPVETQTKEIKLNGEPKENDSNAIFKVMKNYIGIPKVRNPQISLAHKKPPCAMSTGKMNSDQLIGFYKELNNESTRLLRRKRVYESTPARDISEIKLKRTKFEVNTRTRNQSKNGGKRDQAEILKDLYIYKYMNPSHRGNLF